MPAVAQTVVVVVDDAFVEVLAFGVVVVVVVVALAADAVVVVVDDRGVVVVLAVSQFVPAVPAAPPVAASPTPAPDALPLPTAPGPRDAVGPPATFGGGGGGGAPATKHWFAGGAPGIFEIALIAIATSDARQARVPELRRDHLALADRVAEELPERRALPGVEARRLREDVRVRRREVRARVGTVEVQDERPDRRGSGLRVAERDGDVVLVGLGVDARRVLQRRDREVPDLGVAGRDVGDRVLPADRVGDVVRDAVGVRDRRASAPQFCGQFETG